MPKISISYRRDDTGPVTGRLSDRLIERYGAESIFVDIDSIPPGVDFRHHIHMVLRETDVLLAIVGTRWSGALADGKTRIRQDDDPVRIEIATALQNEIFVVPVLVDGAKMPAEGDLPDEIKAFAYRNAVELSSGKDFNVHVKRLIAAIDRTLTREAVALAVAGPSDRVAAPAAAKQPSPEAAPRAASQLVTWWPLLVTYLIAPVILLLLAHYLMIVKFNLDLFYMRASSIAIPAGFGFVLFARREGRPAAAFLFGVAAGAITVAGMLTTVGFIDNRPIVPTSPLEWQEATEYFVGITLAAVGGNLAGRVAASIRKNSGA